MADDSTGDSLDDSSDDSRDPSVTDSAAAAATHAGDAPVQLRAAAIIVAMEAAGLVAAAAIVVAKTLTGHPGKVAGALLLAAVALVGAAALGLGARGLMHLRMSARTPVVVLQLLALPVGYSLAFQAGLVGYGGPILVAALTVLYLIFTPPARAAFDRPPE